MLSLLLEDMFSIYNLSSRSCRERSVYLLFKTPLICVVFSKALFEVLKAKTITNTMRSMLLFDVESHDG